MPNGQRPTPPKKKSEPNYLGILIVALVAVLVLAMIVVAVVAIVHIVGDDEKPDNNPSNGGYVEDDGPIGTTPPAQPDGVKTSPSRTSYQIGQSSSFEYVEGVSPEAAVLVELGSFEMVAGLEFDKRICPASMTKVMTVLIACENLKYLNDTVTVTQDAVNYQATHGASGYGLTAGDTMTVQDLLYLIYYRSDTVACLMISEYIAGSESGFVKLMNDKVKAMGLTNTKFSNSTGLYFEGEDYYTTCRDMAAIMAYALENPLAKKILTQTGTYYLGSGKYGGQAIGPGWKADGGRLGSTDFAGMTIMGGKTGYETVSGSCLITYAKSKSSGKEYIQVVVGGSGSTNASCTNIVKHIYTNYAE